MTTNVIWESKNRLWEILIEHENLIIRNKKEGTRYSVEIDRNQKTHYWFTSSDSKLVPAYVLTKTERLYRELLQTGSLIY